MSFLLPPSALRASTRSIIRSWTTASQGARCASTLSVKPAGQELTPASFEPSLDNPWWRKLIDDAKGGRKQAPPQYEGRKLPIYPAPGKPPVKEVLKLLQAKETAALDPTGWRTKLFSRANPEGAKIGDVLQVRRKNGEPFAGVCINIRRRGVDTGFLLRNQLTRVGVEMWFKIYNPLIEGVDIVKKRAKRARRAKLYYMRQPKHDMGSVQNLVDQFFKSRAGRVGGSSFRQKFAAKRQQKK